MERYIVSQSNRTNFRNLELSNLIRSRRKFLCLLNALIGAQYLGFTHAQEFFGELIFITTVKIISSSLDWCKLANK